VTVVSNSDFGGSGIVQECFEWIRANVPDNSLVLEIGSGPVSTKYLSKYYRVISVEHDLNYIGRFPVEYVHAPLIGAWYDPEPIRHKLTNLREKYALLLVDGPVGSENRAGFIDHIDMFDLSCPVIVDDIERPVEKLIVAHVEKRTGRVAKWFGQFAVI
jgi:hypothetical protein